MKRLANKVAIVTGGASGIGAAIVRVFAKQGATVVCADIDENGGKQIVQHLPRAEFHRVDLLKLDEIEQLVSCTVERHGRLDIMVPNAGIQYEKPLTETTEHQFDQIAGVNLKGAFFSCKFAVQEMLKTGGGCIVATASALSYVAEPNLAAYCATKAGVMNLIKSIATDYGTRNIRANCVCPGYINTPMNDAYFQSLPDPTTARREADGLHALGRMGEPEEVARCVAFLAGDEASFVTGAAWLVDGGLIAKV